MSVSTKRDRQPYRESRLKNSGPSHPYDSQLLLELELESLISFIRVTFRGSPLSR